MSDYNTDDIVERVIAENIEAIASFVAEEVAREAGVWDTVKGWAVRVINSFRDFMGVAQQNGFITFEPDELEEAIAVTSAKRKPITIERLVGPDGERYLGSDAIVTEKVDGYTPIPFEDFYIPSEDEPDAPAVKGADEKLGDTENKNNNVALAMNRVLKKGNAKIDKRVGVWLLPCNSTCPFSTEFCRKFCYAVKGEARSPRTTTQERYSLSRRDDFVEIMVKAITGNYGKRKGREYKNIRVHESGDFYEPEYFLKWVKIASLCPGTDFMAFTKAYDYLERGQKSKANPEGLPPDDKLLQIAKLYRNAVRGLKNFTFNGSIEVPTEMTLQKKRKNEKGNLVNVPREEGGRERKKYRGSTKKKLDSFLNNPWVDGLALVIPKGATLDDALWALGLDAQTAKDRGEKVKVRRSEFFMCPYKQKDSVYKEDIGCAPNPREEGYVHEKGKPFLVCTFCWLKRADRRKGGGEPLASEGMFYKNKRHVAFHQH